MYVYMCVCRSLCVYICEYYSMFFLPQLCKYFSFIIILYLFYDSIMNNFLSVVKGLQALIRPCLFPGSPSVAVHGIHIHEFELIFF